MRSTAVPLLLLLQSATASFFSYEDEGEETAPPAPPTHDDAASSGTSLLVVGLVLAFLSQISMVGKGLQKEAVGGLPALALTKDVLTQYVTSLPWVRGVGVDVAGALLGLAALSILPISVAQPIFCNGIVLLSLFSYFYLKEALAALEWAAVGVCFGGTLLLALTLTPESWEGVDLGWLQLKLLLTLLAVPVALAALHAAAERDPRPSTLELATGCQAGLVIGAGNAAIACGLQVAGVASGLGAAAALGFALAGILLTASHPYFQNRGFKQGRVVVISAYTTLVSMATAVLIGVLVLDEPWPAGVAGVARFVALALIAAGVVLLNWKSIAAEGGLFGGGYARQGADDAATETGKSGFRVKFSLPFKRDDVFKEALSAKEPLGATSRDLKITILRAGAGAADGAVALGCVRKAEFSRPFAGSTVSELVEVVAPERLVWRQLESKAPVVLVGDEGAAAAAAAAALGAAPTAGGDIEEGAGAGSTFTVELAEANDGTAVTLVYKFERIALARPWCFLEPLTPTLLRWLLSASLGKQWRDDMLRRGHASLTDAAAAKLQAIAKGRAVRQATAGNLQAYVAGAQVRAPEQVKKDVDEEAEMKAAMKAKAEAAAGLKA